MVEILTAFEPFTDNPDFEMTERVINIMYKNMAFTPCVSHPNIDTKVSFKVECGLAHTSLIQCCCQDYGKSVQDQIKDFLAHPRSQR